MYEGASGSQCCTLGMCRYVAQHAQVVIAQVDFRLAPEHPVPAQVEDCTAAFKWVVLPTCHSIIWIRGGPDADLLDSVMPMHPS